MPTTLTSKGQVTIPKQIRDALSMTPGCSVAFAVNTDGDVVIHKVGARNSRKPDRFEAARGKADVTASRKEQANGMRRIFMG